MAGMIAIQEAAEKWDISTSMLSRLCRDGRIWGAEKIKGSWMIPADAQYPERINQKNSKGSSMNKSLLPLPVGISDYRKASSEYYYIDKTLMIRDFLDEVPMVSLFTRPRRFGKTLNMDMLRTFFEKSDEDSSKYFVKRKIWTCGEKYRNQQGKYPVIFLSFKDVKCQTWEETYNMIALLIRMEYKRHAELNSNNNPDYDFYERIVQGTADGKDYMLSLMMLSKMLHEYHGIEPMVIIDEYDTPIEQGYLCGFYETVVLFVRNLFSGVFKDNKHLKYGFLTGILRVAKESIFSGLNNLKINSILDSHYSEYFGFTPEEVQDMAAYYGAEDKYEDICAWYDGYRFGSTEIFNPWSVINYFSNGCKPACYWVSTGSNDVIGEMLTHADEETYKRLQSLLQGDSFTTIVDTSVIYPQIQNNPSSVYSFLLVAGYLNAEEVGITPSGDLICKVSLPNKEIAYVYNKEIISKLERFVPPTLVTSLQEAIFDKDTPRLKKLIEKLMLDSVSYFDTTEAFYHGLMVGLLAIFRESFYITSNRESGDGRYDIQMMPISKELPGFIFELKSGNDPSASGLKELAKAALQQIADKRYDSDMSSKGIEPVICYGLAFSGKHVEISCSVSA